MQQPFWKRFAAAEPQQRPLGISLIALGYWLAAALLLVYGIREIAAALSTSVPAAELAELVLDRLRVGVWALLAGMIGRGVWRLRQDSYIVAVALHCFGIFGSLLTWPQIGVYALALSAANIALIAYMMQPTVRRLFRFGQR